MYMSRNLCTYAYAYIYIFTFIWTYIHTYSSWCDFPIDVATVQHIIKPVVQGISHPLPMTSSRSRPRCWKLVLFLRQHLCLLSDFLACSMGASWDWSQKHLHGYMAFPSKSRGFLQNLPNSMNRLDTSQSWQVQGSNPVGHYRFEASGSRMMQMRWDAPLISLTHA